MPALPLTPDAVDDRKLPRYVGQRAVAEMLGKSVRTLHRIRNDDPSFPKPVLNGKQQKAWRVGDIIAWDDARRLAAQQGLVASAVTSPDAIPDDDVSSALEALAARFIALHGEQVAPGDVLSVGIQRQLTDEERAAIAHNAAAKQRELVESGLKRLESMNSIEALLLVRSYLPQLGPFADVFLKRVGLDINMTKEDWIETGWCLVDRVVNAETIAESAMPREVLEALADDGVLSRTAASE
jgi:predicted DNA-binding transcriptional regulator AlpA